VSYRIEDALAADAARIDLNSRQARPAPAPDITVTPAAVSPGELLLTDIAAGLLALASPEQVPLHPSAVRPGPLGQAADGLADIIAALQAAAALSPSSRLPGQLAGLCARLGISGHGIAAPPTGDLPEPWLSLLAYGRRGTPDRAPVPGWAVTATGLPELDGARVTVLALHNGEHGQFLHLLASGITPEYTWTYGTITNRMPVPVATRPHRPLAHRAPGKIGPAAGYRPFHAVAEGRAAAGPRHPADRRGGRRAIGRGPGQAAAHLEAQSLITPPGPRIGRLTWLQAPDTLGHARRRSPISPPKLPRKQHNAPGEPDEVPEPSGVEAVSSW
jgi:hypothetical protein